MYVLRANTAAIPIASLTARLLAATCTVNTGLLLKQLPERHCAVRRVVRCWPMGPVHECGMFGEL